MSNKIRISSFCRPQQNNECKPWSSTDPNFSKRNVQILPYKNTPHLLWSVLARKVKTLQASITKYHLGIKQETRETCHMTSWGHNQQNSACGELNRQYTWVSSHVSRKRDNESGIPGLKDLYKLIATYECINHIWILILSNACKQ